MQSIPTVSEAFRAGPQRFLDVGHSQLAYYRFGNGPDLVFVHGWPLNSATYRKLVPYLASHYTCHLFDLPGAGRTKTGPDSPLRLFDHVDTVKRAIAALGVTSYAFVAHDSGGYVARMIAADDPRVTALVLANTEIPGHTPPLIEMYSALANVPGFSSAMRAALNVGAIRRSGLGLGRCVERADALEGEFKELVVDPVIASKDAMRRQLELIRGVDFHAMGEALAVAHGRIDAPTLLLWGTADPFFPVEKARAMVPQFRAGATFVELEGARLFCHEERAEEFAAHATRFLEPRVNGGKLALS